MLNKLNINFKLEKLFLIASLFPFVSPYPIGSDVQPLAGIFAFFIIIKQYYLKNKSIKKEHLFILVITFTLLFYIDPTKNNIDIRFGKAISLFYGSLVFIAFYYSKQYLTSRLFSNIIKIYFIVSVLTIIFPNILLPLQGYLVRNVNAESIYGIRGILTFCTEPGLFGGLLIAFLVINDYLYKNNKESKNSYLANFAMLLLMLIATKSGTGYLLFILYLILKILIEIKYNLKSILSLFVLILSLIALIYNIDADSSRGLQILMLLATNPMLLFEVDLSILTRVVSLYTGLLSIVHYPLGVGVNDISGNIWFVINDNEFLRSFPKFIDNSNTDKITLVSSFASLTVMYGLIWWILFYLIFFRFSNTTLIAKVFSIVFMLFSFSSAFPLIWILLNLEKTRMEVRT